MPVILSKDTYHLWLDPGFKNVKELEHLMVPFDSVQMRCFPVSTLGRSDESPQLNEAP
jgi:putative SOS response-associated peptidase YedK